MLYISIIKNDSEMINNKMKRWCQTSIGCSHQQSVESSYDAEAQA